MKCTNALCHGLYVSIFDKSVGTTVYEAQGIQHSKRQPPISTTRVSELQQLTGLNFASVGGYLNSGPKFAVTYFVYRSTGIK